MSTPSAVQETSPSVANHAAEANTTTTTTAPATTGTNDTSSSSTAAAATPERKTLIVNLTQEANEDELKALFKADSLPEGSIASVVKEGSNTWFVTFSNGEKALDAFKHANSANVSVRFKTVSSFVSASSPTHTGGHHVHHGQAPYYGFVPVQAQEYQYWGEQQQQHSYQDANGHFYGRDRRGPQPRYGYAPQQTGAAHPNNASGAQGHATGAAGTQGGRHPANKSKGPRQAPTSASATSPNRHASGSAASATSPTTEGQAAGASAGQNASGPRGAGRSSAPRSNASGPAHASGNASQVGRRGPASATGQQQGSERRGNRSAAGNGASTTPSSQSQQHSQHKHSAQEKASLTLTNFPPLPSGGSTKPATRSMTGYGETEFTQYSRETILSVMAKHDASAITRPNFDNSDAPILLTSAQTDLEVNKPLPVGAKFEPLATDKRTRSLSKNRDAPSQPTAAQIVAAAASKPQTSTVKISGVAATKAAATAAAATSADAHKKDERTKQEKASPKTASNKEEKSAKSNAANTSAAPAQPVVMSWADRAKVGKAAPATVAAVAPAVSKDEKAAPAQVTSPVASTTPTTTATTATTEATTQTPAAVEESPAAPVAPVEESSAVPVAAEQN